MNISSIIWSRISGSPFSGPPCIFSAPVVPNNINDNVVKLQKFEISALWRSLSFVVIMVCFQGITQPSFVMACELFAAKYRTFAGIFVENFWAAAMCVFALLAYLVQNWVHLQLIISLFGLLTIPLYWYNTHFCLAFVCLSLTSLLEPVIGIN